MKKVFEITGMHCNSCAKMIEMELSDRVNKISVSYEQGKAEIDFDNKKISEKEIAGILAKMGYKIQ